MKKLMLNIALILSAGNLFGMHGSVAPPLTPEQQQRLVFLKNMPPSGLTQNERWELNGLIAPSHGIAK